MSRSRILLMATLLCVVAASTVVLPVLVVTQETQKPYSEDDVVLLLKGYVPPGRVATLARQRGISFRVTRDVETVLPEAGATDDLLEALRALQPPPPPAGPLGPLRITSKAAGAQVYIDNKLQGTTGAQGRFELMQLKPGSYNLWITRAGYHEYQQKITFVAGQAPDPVLATLSPLPVAFRVEHRHFPVGSCTGSLIFAFGRGTLEFQAGNHSHSFNSPLSQIQYGTYLMGGFWLKTGDGKKRDLDSKSELQVLRLLQYGERALPAPPA